MNWLEILIGCWLVFIGIIGKEFYPGRRGRERGLQPEDPWVGKLIFIGMGLALILDAIQARGHH
ncbi:MAG: hypothetical protein ACLQVL_12720 [Terriglobia bacterium]